METDSPGRPWWAAVVAALALLAATLLLVGMEPGAPVAEDAHATPEMLTVAPAGTVTLAELPADHQRLYEAAAEHPELFEAVRCYCGCEAFLDHGSLRTCFVRPDGGWERHATGCAICLAQARDVLELDRAGHDRDAITRQIDDRYGAMTPTA